MMPPDQETCNIAGNGPANTIHSTNRTENVSVIHAEPSLAASNVTLCPEDRITDQNHEATQARFSILRESLRPVTLKVHITYTIG